MNQGGRGGGGQDIFGVGSAPVTTGKKVPRRLKTPQKKSCRASGHVGSNRNVANRGLGEGAKKRRPP